MVDLSKKKSVEAMLVELSAVDILLRTGVSVEMLFSDFNRAEVEEGGFQTLLGVMGQEQFDSKTFAVLEPLSDDVWHFNTEAIEDHGSYVRIVENCRRLTGGDLKIENLRDYVDVENETAWVEVKVNQQDSRLDLVVTDDWVDPKVFEKLQDWLDESGSQRRFAAQGLEQDVLLICKRPEQIEAINRATGLHFRDLHV